MRAHYRESISPDKAFLKKQLQPHKITATSIFIAHSGKYEANLLRVREIWAACGSAPDASGLDCKLRYAAVYVVYAHMYVQTHALGSRAANDH